MHKHFIITCVRSIIIIKHISGLLVSFDFVESGKTSPPTLQAYTF